MKTFCLVTLYAVMVAVLDLGGGVWTSLRAIHTARTTAVSASTEMVPAKAVNAVRPLVTIPSDT